MFYKSPAHHEGGFGWVLGLPPDNEDYEEDYDQDHRYTHNTPDLQQQQRSDSFAHQQ